MAMQLVFRSPGDEAGPRKEVEKEFHEDGSPSSQFLGSGILDPDQIKVAIVKASGYPDWKRSVAVVMDNQILPRLESPLTHDQAFALMFAVMLKNGAPLLGALSDMQCAFIDPDMQAQIEAIRKNVYEGGAFNAVPDLDCPQVLTRGFFMQLHAGSDGQLEKTLCEIAGINID